MLPAKAKPAAALLGWAPSAVRLEKWMDTYLAVNQTDWRTLVSRGSAPIQSTKRSEGILRPKMIMLMCFQVSTATHSLNRQIHIVMYSPEMHSLLQVFTA